jgi:sugar lactone lactonase YvrE
LGVAVDAASNLYIADTDNYRVRKVTPSGTITTVAGNGQWGYSGDGEPATAASFNEPTGVAVDAVGNLYIADTFNGRIRKVTPAGVITTVAGNGQPGYSGDGGPATAASLAGPWGLAEDAAGNLYIADTGNSRVRKVTPGGTITTAAGNGQPGYSGDGGPATAASLGSMGVAVDAAGNLYIADTENHRVRKVTPAGTITALAGNGQYRYGGDGGPATAASLNGPDGVAVDAVGNLYVADAGNSRIRKVTPAGTITTVAGNGQYGYSGDGGPATAASLSYPDGVAVDAAGNLYIADYANNRVRKVAATGTITTVAGNEQYGYSGDGGPATAASLKLPYGVAVDATGNLYIADTDNWRVRKVTSAGIITTVAGNGQWGYAGDGGPATAASLSAPWGVAVDAAGNLYIADQGNSRIRKVTPGGTITTLAGNGQYGYSGDGGPATAASLKLLYGVAVDAFGNLYIGDSYNSRVRKVTPGGTITTVAGNGIKGYSGDGGLATAASLSYPEGVAVDSAGNLYIADSGNDRIRKVLAAPPSLSVSRQTLAFSAQAGAAGTAAQQVVISSPVTGLAWTAAARTSAGGNWLSVSPASGQLPSALSVSVDATSLAPGTYQGAVDISAPLATPTTVTVAVTLTVTAAVSRSLSVEPAALTFQTQTGSVPAEQTLRIGNAGGGTLGWSATTATASGNWLKLGVTAGSTPASLAVRADVSGLAAGNYSGTITIVSSDTGQALAVPVTLQISAAAGVMLLSQTSMSFRAVEGAGAEPPQTFAVLNLGSGSFYWIAEATASWLRVSPNSGDSVAGTAKIPLTTVSVDATGVAAGSYIGFLRIRSTTAPNSPQQMRVDLRVLPAGTKLGAVVRPTGFDLRRRGRRFLARVTGRCRGHHREEPGDVREPGAGRQLVCRLAR